MSQKKISTKTLIASAELDSKPISMSIQIIITWLIIYLTYIIFSFSSHSHVHKNRNTLSRQSTNESNDSDTTPTQSFIQSSSTINSSGDKQPIKKSPREFIIPISIEGGGIVSWTLEIKNISFKYYEFRLSWAHLEAEKNILFSFGHYEVELCLYILTYLKSDDIMI